RERERTFEGPPQMVLCNTVTVAMQLQHTYLMRTQMGHVLYLLSTLFLLVKLLSFTQAIACVFKQTNCLTCTLYAVEKTIEKVIQARVLTMLKSSQTKLLESDCV